MESAQATDASETAALREAAARSAGEAEGIRQGIASERSRIKSIITSEQYRGWIGGGTDAGDTVTPFIDQWFTNG